MAGRPLKLTAKVREDLCLAIEQGATYEIACGYAGVSYAAFRSWVLRGEAERARIEAGGLAAPAERPFLQFIKRLETANSSLGIECLLKINAAARSDPRWAAWLLERRFPSGYGASQRVDMTISIRDRAEAIAAATGLSADDVIAEAERIVAEAQPR